VHEPDGSTAVYRENPPMTFAQLPSDELLTTRELQRLFDCTARTIYRWIAEYGLEPHGQVGRDYLFRKDKLMKWYRRTWQ
jgi:excisionase family DNA binding protein